MRNKQKKETSKTRISDDTYQPNIHEEFEQNSGEENFVLKHQFEQFRAF